MKNITTEIRKIIADKIEKGEHVIVESLVHEIVSGKEIDGEDRDFFVVCAYSHIKEIVKRCVGKYDEIKATTDKQLTLKGYEHLQVAYTVMRFGQVTLVPISDLSEFEIRARVKELSDMAKGCIAHARELEGYLINRVGEGNEAA